MGRRSCLAGVVGAFGLASLSAAFAAPGQLDSGFGMGGKVRTDIGGADWAGAVAIAPSGAVVVAGGSGADVAVARYDAAGRLDPRLAGGAQSSPILAERTLRGHSSFRPTARSSLRHSGARISRWPGTRSTERSTRASAALASS